MDWRFACEYFSSCSFCEIYILISFRIHIQVGSASHLRTFFGYMDYMVFLGWIGGYGYGIWLWECKAWYMLFGYKDDGEMRWDG